MSRKKRVTVKLAKPMRDGEHPVSKGLADAERAVTARKGKPDEADAPPISTFPATPASREALRMWRQTH